MVEKKDERTRFWEAVYVPINPTYEQDSTPPANPVTVADHFMKAGAIAAYLGSEGERLSEEVHALTSQIEAEERIIAQIRRAVFAQHFSEVKASWSEEIRDAFVLSMVLGTEQAVELDAAYEQIDALREELAPKERRLETLRMRLKTQERIMDWSKQFVDYDKFQGRTTGRQ